MVEVMVLYKAWGVGMSGLQVCVFSRDLCQ